MVQANTIQVFCNKAYVANYSLCNLPSAIIPSSDTYGKVKILIDNERSHNKERFAWTEKAKPGDDAWMLPRFTPAKDLHNVPHQLRMEDARFKHMSEMRSAAKYNVLIAKLRGRVMKRGSVAGCDIRFTLILIFAII